MMKHTHILRAGLLFALILLLALTMTACGSEDKQKATPAPGPSAVPIAVRDPWVRATVPMPAAEATPAEGEITPTPEGMDHAGMAMPAAGPVTGAFMVIENSGTTAQRLIRAAVDPTIAGTVELHETTVGADQVMQMRPVEGIDIPAGGSVALQPGSYHIMLIDLKRALNPGDTVSLTLTFASGLEVTVEAPVREMGSM